MIHTLEGQNTTALIENGIPSDIFNVVEQVNHTVEKTKEWFADQYDIAFSNDTTGHGVSAADNARVASSSTDRTSESEVPSYVLSEVRGAFRLADETIFEQGSVNEFENELERLIESYGIAAVKILRAGIFTESISANCASETLRSLGEINHMPSYGLRLSILIEALFHKNPTVRDGAGLGLANIDDSLAIPYVDMAIRQETVKDLKNDLRLVLTQLEE